MMERNSSKYLLKKLDEEIVLLDGAMGTMIQQHKLEEKDFRNEALADHPNSLQGNKDLLSIARPEIIEQIHTDYLEAGARILGTNTFNANRISQQDYSLEDYVEQLNRALFHYLGQEHLSFAKEISDHLHSIHQRAFDDFQRRLITSPCLLGIFDDEIADTFDQCMLKSHIDTTLPPLKLSSCVLLPFRTVAFRKIEQFLCGIRAAVE